MATVEIKEPKIITFEFHQEKGDEDYGTCLWARFNLDLINYSMSIESDCGTFGYSWVPTPQSESFLKLCSRVDEGYLLEKISNRSVVDGEATWEALKDLISTNADDIVEADWDIDEIKTACFSDKDERNVHDAIENEIQYTNLEGLIEDFDIWECIDKDYPINAKKIVEVYSTHIVPAIKEHLRSTSNG